MRGPPATRDWASGVRTLEKRKATHWRGLTVLGGILTLGLPSPQKRKLMVTQSPNNIHGTKSTSPPSLGPNTSPDPGFICHIQHTGSKTVVLLRLSAALLALSLTVPTYSVVCQELRLSSIFLSLFPNCPQKLGLRLCSLYCLHNSP